MNFNSAFFIHPSAFGRWLPDMDLNHDKQIQSLLCYRYTIPQDTNLFFDSNALGGNHEAV